MIANLVDMQSDITPTNKSHHKRGDSWFVQPAKAEPSSDATAKTRFVNYIDAAQMVLQARASLHANQQFIIKHNFLSIISTHVAFV